MIKDDQIQKLILKKYFGYDSFRSNQLDIIKCILAGNDTLAILPTGGGKSICYQIPALNFKGITLVISPLISLMQDQVTTLQQKRIKATFINSSLDKTMIKLRLQQIKALEHRIIYTAPERLNSKTFIEFAKGLNIDFIAIDEAHCVSQWGHDFRPAYLEIGEFIATLKKRPVVSAFTATATRKVRNDIIKQLNLKQPRKFINSFDRKNLTISVKKVDEMLKMNELLQSINGFREDGVAIIFAQTRQMVEDVHLELERGGFVSAFYHAGLNTKQRQIIQQDFMNNKYKVIVCTNAFGMGIDKPDVRRVYHFGIPSNLENYYQEIGRAGRDSKESMCFLYYSMSDIRQKQYHLKQKYRKLVSEKGKKGYIKVLQKWDEDRLKAILDFLITDNCRKKMILKYFSENQRRNCNKCDNCLTIN